MNEMILHTQCLLIVNKLIAMDTKIQKYIKHTNTFSLDKLIFFNVHSFA